MKTFAHWQTGRASRPPSPHFIPVTILAQQSFLEEDDFNDIDYIVAVTDSVGDAVSIVCHRFGLHCSRVDIVRFDSGVVCRAHLEAGDWHAVATVKRKRYCLIPRAINAEILRLAERDHEQLS